MTALHLAAGGALDEARSSIQLEACCGFDPTEGVGAGVIDAMSTVQDGPYQRLPTYYASLRPFLADDGGGQLQPGVWVRVTHRSGKAVDRRTVFGHFRGSSEAMWSCRTGFDGVCIDFVDFVVADPKTTPLAWAVTVDAVEISDRRMVRPRPAIIASDALDVLTAAMERDSDAADPRCSSWTSPAATVASDATSPTPTSQWTWAPG